MSVLATALGATAGLLVLAGLGLGRGAPAAPRSPAGRDRHRWGEPVGLAVAGAIALATRREVARHRHAVGVALPDAVDLLLLCAGAGLSLPLALPLVAARAPEPVAGALAAAEAAVLAGGRRADALLEHLAPLGDPAAALAHVLVDHLHHGVALGPGLERAALELRLSRRRRAEEAARRLPVRLLAPLLTCVLPAFVLLTVVPLVVAALRSLPR